MFQDAVYMHPEGAEILGEGERPPPPLCNGRAPSAAAEEQTWQCPHAIKIWWVEVERAESITQANGLLSDGEMYITPQLGAVSQTSL